MSSGNDPDFADNAESTGMHVAFSLTFIAGIRVGIRFWWRSSQAGSIGKSDWCVLAALVRIALGRL